MTNESRNNNFIITFDKIPTVEFYATDIPLPGFNLGESIINTRTLDFTVPSDKVDFDPLTITFNVDENLKNYIELYSWVMDLGHPERSKVNRPDDKDATSDATLTVLNNQKNPIVNINIKDAFPLSVGELAFNLQTSEPVICTATFKYSWFEVVVLNE